MFIIKNAGGVEIARLNEEELKKYQKEGLIKPSDQISEL